MKIKNIIIAPIYIDQIAQEIKSRVEQNEYTRKTAVDGYGKAYTEGYHDAMIEILDYLGVEHDQEYYN